MRINKWDFKQKEALVLFGFKKKKSKNICEAFVFIHSVTFFSCSASEGNNKQPKDICNAVQTKHQNAYF